MGGPLLSVSFSSKPQVKAMLAKCNAAVRPAMAAGLYQLGCGVISDAIPRTPKDTGTLRNSAYCELPKGRGDNVTVTGGFGGFAKKYALVQHENTTFRHTEGSAKYLDKAFKKIGTNAARFLAAFMANAIESGTKPSLNSLGVQTAPGPKGSEPKKKRGRKKTKKKAVKRRTPKGGARKGRR